MKKAKKKSAFFLLSIFAAVPILFGLTSCTRTETKNEISDYHDAEIGFFDKSDKEAAQKSRQFVFPHWHEYDNDERGHQAAIEDVKNGKLDGFIADYPIAEYLINNSPNITSLNQLIHSYGDSDFGYALAFCRPTSYSEPYDLENHLNSAIDYLNKSQTIQSLKTKWFDVNSTKTLTDIKDAGPNPIKLKVYYDPECPPMCYKDEGDNLTGFEYDLLINAINYHNENHRDGEPVYALDSTEYSTVSGQTKDDKIFDFRQKIWNTDFQDRSLLIGCIPHRDSWIRHKSDEECIFSSNPILDTNGVRFVVKTPDDQIHSLSQLNDYNRRIGIKPNSLFANDVKNELPNAQYYVYNSTTDCIAAARSNKIDAFFTTEVEASLLGNDFKTLFDSFPEEITAETSFAFNSNATGRKICDEFNAFFKDSKYQEEIKALQHKWLSLDNAKNLPQAEPLPYNPNGEQLIYYTPADSLPYDYYSPEKKEFSGYEIDLLRLFAKKCGYNIKEEKEAGFDTVISKVTTDDTGLSIGGGSLTGVTTSGIVFSTSTSESKVIGVVLNKTFSDNRSFWQKIVDAFYSTFIEEGRYKLFLQGILNTFLIVIASIAGGTIIGFLLFLLLRATNLKLLDKLLGAVSWLLTGLPEVVTLMIFFYVIFRNVQIEGLIVSMVVFSLLFACSVFSLLGQGVATVDKGQEEAATALGYKRRTTFMKIILPQAAKQSLPGYKSAITSLIKSTSIVGYVAVQDLTKIADIIRNQTFEAFFPLIAVAIIYILFALLFEFIVNRINFSTDPKHRSQKRIIRGIKTDDN
ncbi:MAG: transporter substrate-binding domain-containing protein [Bacilli bacterium]|nr:transporter substrate-binding domain-containing protein [Bacilli bacterium]